MDSKDKFYMKTGLYNNWPHVEASWNGRASWRVCGTGRKRVKFYRLPSGSLEMEAVEIADPERYGGRPTVKEVMISIPKEVVSELARILNEGGSK